MTAETLLIRGAKLDGGGAADLIVEGRSMSERDLARAQASEAAFQSYVRETAGSGASSADELTKLAELHKSGVLSDDEFATQKAKLLA